MTPSDLRGLTPTASVAVKAYLDDWRLWHLPNIEAFAHYLAECGVNPDSAAESTYTTVARALKGWLHGEAVTIRQHEAMRGLKDTLALLGLDLGTSATNPNIKSSKGFKAWCAPLAPFDSAKLRELYAGELPFVTKTRPMVRAASPELEAVFIGIFGALAAHPILAVKIMAASAGMTSVHPLAAKFIWCYDTRGTRLCGGRAYHEAILAWATEGLRKEKEKNE